MRNSEKKTNATLSPSANITIIKKSEKSRGEMTNNLIEKSAEDIDSSQKRKWKWPLTIWKDIQYHIRDKLIKASLKHGFSPVSIKFPKVGQCSEDETREKVILLLQVAMQNKTNVEGNLSSSGKKHWCAFPWSTILLLWIYPKHKGKTMCWLLHKIFHNDITCTGIPNFIAFYLSCFANVAFFTDWKFMVTLHQTSLFIKQLR